MSDSFFGSPRPWYQSPFNNVYVCTCFVLVATLNIVVTSLPKRNQHAEHDSVCFISSIGIAVSMSLSLPVGVVLSNNKQRLPIKSL